MFLQATAMARKHRLPLLPQLTSCAARSSPSHVGSCTSYEARRKIYVGSRKI